MQPVRLFVWSLIFLIAISWRNGSNDIGSPIDALNGVIVYYNGNKITNVTGRHLTADGYNLGLKYQCVEFVKRYYYEYFDHKMPNSYGHAKDFFDKNLGDEDYNKNRNLLQYRNVRKMKPEVNDILVFDSYPGNPFGHVAIISEIGDEYIEIVHQNTGKKSRVRIPLIHYLEYWTVADENVLGWLRLQKSKI